MMPPTLVLLIGGLATLAVGAVFALFGDRQTRVVGVGLVSSAVVELGVKVAGRPPN